MIKIEMSKADWLTIQRLLQPYKTNLNATATGVRPTPWESVDKLISKIDQELRP